MPPGRRAQSQFWMKPEQGKAVRQFVEAGGSALFLHNTTHVGLTDPDFRHVLGAAYTGHPPIRTFKVKVTNPDHPITQGRQGFRGHRRTALHDLRQGPQVPFPRRP